MKIRPRLCGARSAVSPTWVAQAQITDTEPGAVAGLPANYTEARSGGYTLPDPLTCVDGQRVTLLQTGSTDKWSDPSGEFLAAKAATPAFGLLGQKGIEQFSLPAAGTPLLNTLGYLMHDGPHGVVPADWPVYLDFLDAHLKPVK